MQEPLPELPVPLPLGRLLRLEAVRPAAGRAPCSDLPGLGGPTERGAQEVYPAMQITFKQVENKGSLVALATVPVTEKISVAGWQIFERDGRRWSHPPSRRLKNPDGSPRYEEYILFESREMKQRWCERVCERYAEWLAGRGPAPGEGGGASVSPGRPADGGVGTEPPGPEAEG